MRTIVLVVILLGFYGTIMAQQPNDVSMNELIGKVKRVDERSATVIQKNGKQKEEKSGLEKSLIFDEKGRLTLKIFTGLNTSETRYSYEKNGIRKAITDRTEPFEKHGAIKIPGYSASRFTFNETENSILEETFYGKIQTGPILELAGRSHQYKYFFDKTNRLVKKEYLSPEGDNEITTKEFFHRENTPTPTDVIISSKGDVLQFIKCTYEIDDNGNWTKRIEIKKPIDPKNPTVTEVTYRKISYYRD